jgi:5'-deoxynucleotidase
VNDSLRDNYRRVSNIPVSDDLKVLGLTEGWIRRLAHITRFSIDPMLRRQSVAEHCFFAAMLAYIMAEDMRKRGFDVSPELAASKALFHDMEEAHTGDIVVPFKYNDPDLNDKIKERGQAFLKAALYQDIGEELGEAIYTLWDNAKDYTLEGRIVAFCDLLEIIGYIGEEVSMGNSKAEYLRNTARKLLSPYLRMPEFSPYISNVLDLFCGDVDKMSREINGDKDLMVGGRL